MALAQISYDIYPTFRYVKEENADYNKTKDASRRLLRQIPLEKLMDLKIDYAFKQLFGSEKNKEITVVFLNAILQKTNRNPIKDITFLNTEFGREYIDDKLSKLDLLVTTDANERINVEIQFTNKYNMIKRSLFYWAGVYRSPLGKRMSYTELRPVISINILNFNTIKASDRFHTTYHLYEDHERFLLTNLFEVHFIEMPKLIKDWKENKLDPWNDVLARWLLLLGIVDIRKSHVYNDIYNELEGIAMKDETLYRAFQSWEELSMTQEQYFAYEARLKHILDEEAYQREKELHEERIKVFEQEKEMFDQEREIFDQEKEIFDQEKEIFDQEKASFKIEKETLKQERELLKQEIESIEQEKISLEEKEKQFKQMEESIKRRAKELAVEAQKINEKVHQKIREEKQAEKEAIALRLLNAGLDLKAVAGATGLTEERLLELQQNKVE